MNSCSVPLQMAIHLLCLYFSLQLFCQLSLGKLFSKPSLISTLNFKTKYVTVSSLGVYSFSQSNFEPRFFELPPALNSFLLLTSESDPFLNKNA